MTARRAVSTRLLLAASLLAGVAATQPAQAQPTEDYVAAAASAPVEHSFVPRGVVIQRTHFVPLGPDRFDPSPPSPTSADVLPVRHDNDPDIDEPAVRLVPEMVHYARAPIGLDDSPTTFGLVAKF
jgi:hypothetical protein